MHLPYLPGTVLAVIVICLKPQKKGQSSGSPPLPFEVHAFGFSRVRKASCSQAEATQQVPLSRTSHGSNASA